MVHFAKIIHSYIHNGRIGVLVELGMRSDYTARLEVISQLLNDLAIHIAGAAPRDLEELLDQHFVKDESKTIRALLFELSESLDEKLGITRFVRWDVEEQVGEAPTPPRDPATRVKLSAVK